MRKGTSAIPGIDGIEGVLPVAMRRNRPSSVSVPSSDVTSTVRGPVTTAVPDRRVTPQSLTEVASETCEYTDSRAESIASHAVVGSGAAICRCRTVASSSAFDGIEPLHTLVPPMRPRSTAATRRPSSCEAKRAAVRPAGPSPTITRSYGRATASTVQRWCR